jgi:hypothetical protein
LGRLVEHRVDYRMNATARRRSGNKLCRFATLGQGSETIVSAMACEFRHQFHRCRSRLARFAHHVRCATAWCDLHQPAEVRLI